MTKEEYMQFHKDFCEVMKQVTADKNADYTGDDPSPFSNFTRVEAMGICSTEQGFLTRMTDKMARLTSFVQKGTFKVHNESVTDTLMDLANYSILMAGYLRSKRQAAQEKFERDCPPAPHFFSEPTSSNTAAQKRAP